MVNLKSIKGIVVLFVFTVLTAVSCDGGDDSVESVRLALDWYPNANHIGLYIAVEKGYFDDIKKHNRAPPCPRHGRQLLQACRTCGDI